MTSRSTPRLLAALTPPGPAASRAELTGVVETLRRAARTAPEEVGRITGLAAAARRAGEVPVLVVDRPRFQQANVELFDAMLAGSGIDIAAGRLDVGAVLAFLSTKVLGQYDPLHRRLLLVAPNVMHVERELDLDGMDFRLWVCLHESTHAVQFAAAPWLADHIAERTRTLLAGLDETHDGGARTLFAALARSARGEGDVPVTELLLPPELREQMAEISAIMALLEGHADVVMDAISPARLPSVRRIRAAFSRKRANPSPVEKVLRKALGLDEKLAQYRDGAAFVTAVVEDAGHAGLNEAFRSAGNLPTPAEIADPGAWLERVGRRR